MKKTINILVSKVICFFTGDDWRRRHPELWDLSKVFIYKEYGGNDGFLEYFYSTNRITTFSNGVDVEFFSNSLIVKKITGCTNSSFCNLAIPKESFSSGLRK